MLLSLLLYGSRARGDYRQNSDVDLLAVTDRGPVRQELAIHGASLYHYPISLLRANAARGDLFILHLVKEGKILHDTAGLFQTVIDAFSFRDDYDDVIRQASFIILFIAARQSRLTHARFRKRLIWAMRTVIIARAAEKKLAIFGSADLANFCHYPDLKYYIDSRDEASNGGLVNCAMSLLEILEISAIVDSWPSDRKEQRILMAKAGGLAENTLSFVLSEPAMESIRNSAKSKQVSPVSTYIW